MVEIVLMKEGHHDVARDYIIYRDKHKILREDSPQNLKLVREDGSAVRFNPMKIASALEEAFRRTQQTLWPIDRKNDRIGQLSHAKSSCKGHRPFQNGDSLTDSLIEDEIEQQLMREGFFAVAKDYILQRGLFGKQSKDRLHFSDKRRARREKDARVRRHWRGSKEEHHYRKAA